MKGLVVGSATVVAGLLAGVLIGNWVLAFLQDYDDDIWYDDESY